MVVRSALETPALVSSPDSFPENLCGDQVALQAGEGPMVDVIDDLVLCPLWGVLVENTEITAGPLGLCWAMDTLGFCPPGQGLKVDMEISFQQPLQARQPSAAACLRRRGKTDTVRLSPTPRGSPDHSEKQMQEPSAFSTMFPKLHLLGLVAWGQAETPVEGAGRPLRVQMRNVAQMSSVSSFFVAPHARIFFFLRKLFRALPLQKALEITPWETSLSDTYHLRRKWPTHQATWHLERLREGSVARRMRECLCIGVGTSRLTDGGSQSLGLAVRSEFKLWVCHLLQCDLRKGGSPRALGSSSVNGAAHE